MMHRFHFYSKKFLLALVGFALTLNRQTSHALELGIFPYADPVFLAEKHAPLRQLLNQTTQKTTRMRTAKNYAEFIQNTQNQKYDVLVTAPHLGRKAQLSGDYELLGFTKNRSKAIFLSQKQHGVSANNLKLLENHRLATPPSSAIISQLAKKSMVQAGVKLEQITFIETSSHHNALLALIANHADFAVVGEPTWKKFHPKGADQLYVLAESASIPGFAILVKKSLEASKFDTIKHAILSFDKSELGQKYYINNGLIGFSQPETADLNMMDAFLSSQSAP